jgi:hypothetical protein
MTTFDACHCGTAKRAHPDALCVSATPPSLVSVFTTIFEQVGVVVL